jgi:hypothetical protein
MYGDWHALGEVQYRKWPVYEPMQWENNLRIDDYIVSGASYGGPLALVRDHKRLIPVGEELGPPKLRIFSSAGQKMSEVI